MGPVTKCSRSPWYNALHNQQSICSMEQCLEPAAGLVTLLTDWLQCWQSSKTAHLADKQCMLQTSAACLPTAAEYISLWRIRTLMVPVTAAFGQAAKDNANLLPDGTSVCDQLPQLLILLLAPLALQPHPLPPQCDPPQQYSTLVHSSETADVY